MTVAMALRTQRLRMRQAQCNGHSGHSSSWRLSLSSVASLLVSIPSTAALESCPSYDTFMPGPEAVLILEVAGILLWTLPYMIS